MARDLAELMRQLSQTRATPPVQDPRAQVMAQMMQGQGQGAPMPPRPVPVPGKTDSFGNPYPNLPWDVVQRDQRFQKELGEGPTTDSEMNFVYGPGSMDRSLAGADTTPPISAERVMEYRGSRSPTMPMSRRREGIQGGLAQPYRTDPNEVEAFRGSREYESDNRKGPTDEQLLDKVQKGMGGGGGKFSGDLEKDQNRLRSLVEKDPDNAEQHMNDFVEQHGSGDLPDELRDDYEADNPPNR